MSKVSISRLESLLRRVVEQPFSWLSDSKVDPYAMAAHILQLLQQEADGGREVSAVSIYLSPEQYHTAIESSATLQDDVADYIQRLAKRTGAELPEVPEIVFGVDASLGQRQARVVLAQESGMPEHTQVFTMEPGGHPSVAIRDADAYLIVGGRRHFALDGSLTRIGRHIENDLILDVPSVSRRHAQIRWREPNFVLYDVTGRNRTRLNGEPVSGEPLKSGDVITLGEVMLVFGEGRIESPDNNLPDEGAETLLKPQ